MNRMKKVFLLCQMTRSVMDFHKHQWNESRIYGPKRCDEDDDLFSSRDPTRL